MQIHESLSFRSTGVLRDIRSDCRRDHARKADHRHETLKEDWVDQEHESEVDRPLVILSEAKDLNSRQTRPFAVPSSRALLRARFRRLRVTVFSPRLPPPRSHPEIQSSNAYRRRTAS